MFDSRYQSRRATACKALVALIGATGCLAAVAYAASAPNRPGERGQAGAARPAPASGAESRQAERRPPRPRIVRHPRTGTLSSKVSFRYTSRVPGPSFECRLDDSSWKPCAAGVSYRGLAPGPHVFLVRVESRDGGRSRPARFSWLRTQPKRFAIEADLSALDKLYPGAPPVALPLLLENPNPAPILVTALRVSVSADPAGCASAANLELVPSNASPRLPLQIPAGGTTSLPAAGISPPAVALRNLPVNQDACQGAQFPLIFSGSAHG
jgi:hypothetical protein